MQILMDLIWTFVGAVIFSLLAFGLLFGAVWIAKEAVLVIL